MQVVGPVLVGESLDNTHTLDQRCSTHLCRGGRLADRRFFALACFAVEGVANLLAEVCAQAQRTLVTLEAELTILAKDGGSSSAADPAES